MLLFFNILLQIYPYERLKISHFDLPKDVDRNMLEVGFVGIHIGLDKQNV